MIDRTKGSTETVGLGAASGITLDTIADRLSPTKIWASPIWICWTKDRTSSRSSSDASLVQRSASFADRSNTARWVAASRPSGATESLTSTPDANSDLAVESRQKIQNSGLPLRSRRARRVLNSNTAALMLAQRAPGETAFGCVHQPTSQPRDDRDDGGGLDGVLHEVTVKASP
jgi:hypothetical protein